MICFSAESSGHQAVAAFSAPYVATGLGPYNLVLLLYVFFQGAVFGAGLNVVPGNVNVSTPVHVARMPCSSWPHKELR